MANGGMREARRVGPDIEGATAQCALDADKRFESHTLQHCKMVAALCVWPMGLASPARLGNGARALYCG